MVAALSMAATEIAIPSLTEFAHSLADSHSPLTRASRSCSSFADCNDIARVLNRSARAFRAGHEGEVSHQKAGEMAARQPLHLRARVTSGEGGAARWFPSASAARGAEGEARVLLMARRSFVTRSWISRTSRCSRSFATIKRTLR